MGQAADFVSIRQTKQVTLTQEVQIPRSQIERWSTIQRVAAVSIALLGVCALIADVVLNLHGIRLGGIREAALFLGGIGLITISSVVMDDASRQIPRLFLKMHSQIQHLPDNIVFNKELAGSKQADSLGETPSNGSTAEEQQPPSRSTPAHFREAGISSHQQAFFEQLFAAMKEDVVWGTSE